MSSSSDRDLFIAYGALMTGAFLPIYFGSFNSLRTPLTTIELKKQRRKANGKGSSASDDDEEWDSDSEGETGVTERLTSSDAWLFPVFGSAVLFGMFLVFKYLNKEYVNMLLGFYFGVVGVLAVTKVLVGISRSIVGRILWNKMTKFKLELTQRGEGEIFKVRFTPAHLGLFAVSCVLIVYYLLTKNWIVSNMLALSLSVNAIGLMSLDSFRTGVIMLGGLFLYDIFWVFGTPVMVSVARNFDAPIKIIWPKNAIDAILALRSGSKVPDLQFTMLGLGDIVIPGIFVALALRYDQTVASERKPSARFTRTFTAFPKPYFTATLIAYVGGLATTMGVMHIFRAAQPALLYLSPACSGALLLTAAARGEFSEVWNWTDEDDEEAEEEEKKKAKAEGDDGGEKLEKGVEKNGVALGADPNLASAKSAKSNEDSDDDDDAAASSPSKKLRKRKSKAKSRA
ncbi:hypothetical protein IE53DRAFT_262438 [Violaceomyces palustris]|uniref:Uncharacterized protein n=1 Tax=Violaceomyces palustris TaxID=1673888 RepID=A0ACD0NN64_9BASI|nr:hypothetical protein IE53DRAFT_262438 [Violaceomyces palustris]